MSKPKLYAKRNPMKQGQAFLDHMEAMTAEGLDSKADIAEELAHRDIRIAELGVRVKELEDELIEARHDIRICIDIMNDHDNERGAIDGDAQAGCRRAIEKRWLPIQTPGEPDVPNEDLTEQQIKRGMRSGVLRDQPKGMHPNCTYCNSPKRDDGSTIHVSGCAGLEDVRLNRLQHDALVARAERPREPPHCSTCECDPESWGAKGPVAPVACVTVGEDDTLHITMYAPGLPPGQHDLFPVPLNPKGRMEPMWPAQPPPASTCDKGPWIAQPGLDGRYNVGSEDFEYDVWLNISGDFGTPEIRKQYCEWLAAKLNGSPPPPLSAQEIHALWNAIEAARDGFVWTDPTGRKLLRDLYNRLTPTSSTKPTAPPRDEALAIAHRHWSLNCECVCQACEDLSSALRPHITKGERQA
jgi:hypothetical protein